MADLLMWLIYAIYQKILTNAKNCSLWYLNYIWVKDSSGTKLSFWGGPTIFAPSVIVVQGHFQVVSVIFVPSKSFHILSTIHRVICATEQGAWCRGPQFVLIMQIIAFSTNKTKLTSDGKENSLHTFKPVTLYYGLLWHDV